MAHIDLAENTEKYVRVYYAAKGIACFYFHNLEHTASVVKAAELNYAPTAVVKFTLSSSSYLDAGVRYDASTEFTESNSNGKINLLALRVAYDFLL